MKPVFVLILASALVGNAWTACAQSEYAADGSPTPQEEEIRWQVNRGRFDSASENRARGTSYTDIPATAGPLAPNQSLTAAARHHSEDMARNNVFQHATVTGSGYYDAVAQPEPWDRMEAEGYSWTAAAENIAAGYADPGAVYVGWWNSSGHRHNMYDSNLREIGNGYFYWSSSTYQRYYTMDLGSYQDIVVFTDTLFLDANANGAYEQGEGIAGIAVRLLIGGKAHTNFDLSTPVGSFAIPIRSIAAGSAVQVVLSNTTAARIKLTVPRDYQTFTPVILGPGEARLFGSFVRPSTRSNVGLRDVAPAQGTNVSPALTVSRSASQTLLHWPSNPLLAYLPQRSTNLLTWTSLTNSYQAGTGGSMAFRDPAPAPRQSFYRLLIR